MYKLFKRTLHPGVFEVQLAGACDPGIARDHNEDAISMQEDDGRGYWMAIVCDGMGGHNAGEVASAMAVELIRAHVAEHFTTDSPEKLLTDSFIMASKKIDAYADINPDARGMGCTAVAVLGIRDKFWVAHSGDSRCYRVRGGKIEQITTDHTMVQEMVDSGIITPEQAAVHPYRGRISRCLGHGKNRDEPTVNAFELVRGDNLLLCSDGLSDVVEDDEIAVLALQRDPRAAVGRLVDAANKGGGPDNISALLVRRTL
jgi:protein phosphatase